MNTYSDDNPPTRGTGRKIYQALKRAGFDVHDLHYNANCWGRGSHLGWGTWACHIGVGKETIECLCGWDDKGAYLYNNVAPFGVLRLRTESDEEEV